MNSDWSLSCTSALSHASSMAQVCRFPGFANLIHSETNRFVELPPPASSEEQEARRRQRYALSSRISLISHADSMASIEPSKADRMLQVVTDFCSHPLPCSEDEGNEHRLRGFQVSSQIARI